MRDRILLVTAISFFLAVNTSYYWEGRLGFYALPAFLLLAVVWLVLSIALASQLFQMFREGFSDRQRLLRVGALTVVLVLAFYKPNGVIDFDRMSGEDLLIAGQEGVANCTTTLKLKKDNTFSCRSVCFGIREFHGRYEHKGDTIVFRDVTKGREGEGYAYALIKLDKVKKAKYPGEIICYRDAQDTSGYPLVISKLAF